MAVTYDPFVKSDLDARISEVWTPIILEEMFAASCASNFFTDLSSYAKQAGGDILHVADVYTNSFTPKTQTTQGAEVDTESPAQVDVTLSLTTHKYIATLYGKFHANMLLKSFDFNEVYARKMGLALIDALEQSLFGLWSGLSVNTPVNDTASVLSDADVRNSISNLAARNHNAIGRAAFFVHPAVYWLQLAGIAKYYDASSLGAGVKSITRAGNFGEMDFSRGLVGGLYGIPVYTSTNVVSNLGGYRNLLALPEAFGFAVVTSDDDNLVEIKTTYENRNMAWLTVADIQYGVAELRDEAAVVMNANTSLIVS